MPAKRGTRVTKTEHREVGSRRRGRNSVHAPVTGRGAETNLPMLRTSERGTLKRCEFLWDLSYNRQLKPQVEMPALRFGTLVHKSLADYYIPGKKRGEHPATAFERHYEQELALTQELFGMKVGEDETWVSAAELGPAMLNNYVETYGSDDRYEVIATEMPFKVLVYRPSEGFPTGSSFNEPWFWYTGIVDGVWRDLKSKELWIPDHKTTDGIGDKKFTHLTLDDQAGSYWSWGVDFLYDRGILKPNQKLNGMLYNFLRKAMPDERESKLVKGQRVYLNKDGSISQRQPPAYFKRIQVFRDEYDREQAKRRAMIDYHRIELFRSGELEISKNPGQFTCPMCSMRDACELHETGNDWEEFLSATTRTWEPYSEHEIMHGR